MQGNILDGNWLIERYVVIDFGNVIEKNTRIYLQKLQQHKGLYSQTNSNEKRQVDKIYYICIYIYHYDHEDQHPSHIDSDFDLLNGEQ